MRLQREGTPDAAHRAAAQPRSGGQRARAPMRRVLRCRFQRHCQRALHFRIAYFARRAWTWFIQQPIQPPVHKALPPLANRLVSHLNLLGHPRIIRTLGAQ